MVKMATKTIRLTRARLGEENEKVEDEIAVDEAICLFVNMEHFRILVASPVMIKELAVGHLFSEGVINGLGEVKKVEVGSGKVYIDLKKDVDLDFFNEYRREIITTACGAPIMGSREEGLQLLNVTSTLAVEAKKILEMVSNLNQKDSIFRKTGGTHIAMLCDSDANILAFSEDVGRHNAVDKVIGYALLNDIQLDQCVLVSSGRQSGEMVLKAAHSGVPIVASISAPIESGRKVAEDTGVTLIGFVRGSRMNIVTHPRRIIVVH